MNACLSQSTKHSDMSTTIAGLKMTCNREKVGSAGSVKESESDAGRNENRDEEDAEDNSIRLRSAMMKSMMPNWNRSTMSASQHSECQSQHTCRWCIHTGASELEQILLFEFLEDAALDLDKLI